MSAKKFSIKTVCPNPLTAVVPILVVVFQISSPVFAHAPHDVVQGVAISPTFSTDNTIYGVVRNNLLKSINRGVKWKRLVYGIDNNESPIRAVAIDPMSPNFLYLSTASEGVYKSEDAGRSWHKINQGLDKLTIGKLYVPAAQNHAVLFAVSGNRSLYRTLNSGANWTKVYDNPEAITAINGFGWVFPNNRHVLVGDDNGTLSQSTDGGLIWHKILELPNCGAINSIESSRNPLLRNTFFIGTGKCGIFRTADGGKSFQAANIGIKDLNIQAIAISPTFKVDATVFASTWSQAIFVSTNGGLAWSKFDNGLTIDNQGGESSPHFSGIAVSADFKTDKTIFLAGFDGLFRSVNGGMQWHEMDTLPTTLIQSIAISPDYGQDATIALTTYRNGIYMSADDGGAWNGIADNITDRNNDIAFSPSYYLDGTIFATMGGSQHTQIGKSADRGKTWTGQPINNGWPTIIAVSPAFIHDQTLFVVTRSAHLNRSTDGGRSFTSIYDEGINPDCAYCVSSLAISPNFSDDRTLLLATKRGVFMSNDSGGTWSIKGRKTTFGQQVKLAFSPNYAADHTLFIGGTAGLFRTVDNFKTWHKISGYAKGVDGYIEELAISPNFKNDKTFLMTVRGKGLFKSQDNGLTFKAVAKVWFKNNFSFALWAGFPVASSSSIRFSPAYATDKTVFATSSDRLFRSHDGGDTWAPVVIHSKFGK